MAKRYAGYGNDNATATRTLWALSNPTVLRRIRPVVYDIVVGTYDLPADQAFNFQVRRHTSWGGPKTARTPQPLNPAYPASHLFIGTGYSGGTGEPTYTTSVMSWSMNQQATFRWVVPPEMGIVLPSTLLYGLGLQWTVVSGGTAGTLSTVYWEE